jgi:dipeptidyl-peptidase 4
MSTLLSSTLRRSLLAASCIAAFPAAAAAQQVDYHAAEQLLGWNTSRLVYHNEATPNWIEGSGSRFWYRVQTRRGAEFMLVDPDRRTKRHLFDNARLAAAMSVAADTAYRPERLPFSTFDFVEGERVIQFNVARRQFRCDIQRYSCTVGAAPRNDNGFVVSPDSAWEAFAHEYNLWVRPRGGADSVQLTTDGEEYYSYAVAAPRPGQLMRGQTPTPQLRWSPDSRRILVYRIDERDVEHMPIYSSTSQRPRGFTYPYALPGDSIVPLPTLHVIDVPTRNNVRIAIEPRPNSLSLGGSPLDSVWTRDSRHVHFSFITRGSKSSYLVRADAETGSSVVLARDTSATWVDLGLQGPQSWHVTDDGQDVIWWSQRDGWAHLYRYQGPAERADAAAIAAANGNGGSPGVVAYGGPATVKNQISSGAFAVGTLMHVDQRNRAVYFTARGREEGRVPHYAHVYRASFDGSGVRLLTPEDGNHTVRFSPDGRFFVDTYSRIDTPPVSVLRAATDGRVVMTLEEADITDLVASGWTAPQVFRAKGRDGITDIYGVIFVPPHLDPSKKYPIISHIYPGPQRGSVESWSFKDGNQRGEPHSLAMLGFVVVQIDHMGSPHRSKAFHDIYYGDMGDNGLPDHMAVMRELAARHSWIDLDRVGIYGHSGGGFASTDAILRHPDFFHVAVSTAGNHDNRSYNIYWAEKYQGLLERDTLRGTDSYENQVNALLAENLRGKLLLVHGDMDDNVHPAMTLQVANALIAANKDFDLLIVPDRAHGLDEPYVIRRRWDYFVRHLLGLEPPREFEIRRPEN